MNRRAMSKLVRPAVYALAFTLAACSDAPADKHDSPPLAGARIGAPFTLVGSNGQPVHWRDFDGRYRIVYFGYTFCPDVCPLDVQTMMQGRAQFATNQPALAKKVQPIFISIDPRRDTPARLAQYEDAFGPGLVALTGSDQQIAAVAKAFAAYYALGETVPGGGYLMDHSRAAYLMGPKGQPFALLPVDKTPKDVAAELAKWVR